MRCSRCHGLLVFDECWSRGNDYRKVEGIRCVNCGNFTGHMPGIVRAKSARRPRQVVA